MILDHAPGFLTAGSLEFAEPCKSIISKSNTQPGQSPLCRNDVFIMEAIKDIGLTLSQLQQINACRMYLNVTTVAKITDHTGAFLLPQALLKHPAQSPQGLQEISTSTLTWPCIHCPSMASWKLWTKTMCNLFTGSPSNLRLTTLLGAWTMEYQQYRRWHWRLAPTGRLLHQSQTMHNPRAAIQIRAQRTQLTFSLTIPTNQRFDGPPVTPADTYHRTIKLPVLTLSEWPQITPPQDYHRSLITQFRTKLQSWQRPLFGPIKQLQPMAHI